MGPRKQVPQPRACAQCGTTFYTARKGHVHCRNACNTREVLEEFLYPAID